MKFKQKTIRAVIEISKLIKNCNLLVENTLKYHNCKHKVIHKVRKTLGRLRKYGLVAERL